MKCVNCNKDISQLDKFCGSCGAKNEHYINEKQKFCPSCGQKIDLRDKYCEFCGALTEEQIDYSNKSKYIAGVLAFILGIFGAHDFYLEKARKGIIKLLTTILMIIFIVIGSILLVYSVARAPEVNVITETIIGILLIIMGVIGIFFLWILCVYQGLMILTDKNAKDIHGKPFK